MADTQITEKLSFQTDIIQSYSGKEQRIKVRQYPRKFYTYNYDAMDKFQAQWLRAILRIPQNEIYYIPMWQDVIHLTEDYYNGSALYVEEETMYNLYGCDMIEVFKHDDLMAGNVNVVRQVKRYSNGIIALVKRVGQNLNYKNTNIFPLKPCRVQSPFELNYVYSNGTSTSANFEEIMEKPTVNIPYNYISDYQEDEYFNRHNLPQYFNNREILTYTPQWIDDDSVSLSINKNVERLDNNTGIVQFDMLNTKSYDTHTMNLYLMSRKMINNCKRFFYKVCGRYKSFYAPTWVNDIELYGDIIRGDIYFMSEFVFSSYYKNNTRIKNIVIFTRDMQSYIYTISRYENKTIDNKTYSKIYLTEALRESIKHDDVLMISYLNLVRLDSDDLELNYETDGCCQVTLSMKEVDDT